MCWGFSMRSTCQKSQHLVVYMVFVRDANLSSIHWARFLHLSVG